jgi:hypothetical protein
MVHCPHHSSREATTTDNFTRARTSSFLEKQILSRFADLNVPRPLSSWLSNLVNDWDLPIKLLNNVMCIMNNH